MHPSAPLRDYPYDKVCVACDVCKRRRIYSKKNLIKIYGFFCSIEKVARMTTQSAKQCQKRKCAVYLPDLGSKITMVGTEPVPAPSEVSNKSVK